MEERKRLLIVQEAMGGCGRNVVDIVNGIDHSKFDVTVAYGTSRMDDYYRNAIPEMDQHATLIPVPELVRDLSMSNDVSLAAHTWAHQENQTRHSPLPQFESRHHRTFGGLWKTCAKGVLYTPCVRIPSMGVLRVKEALLRFSRTYVQPFSDYMHVQRVEGRARHRFAKSD